MKDLVIIGSGAAGLSAAMYALGKKLDFVLVASAPGKAGWRQQLAGQSHEEFLPGSDAVAQLQVALDAQPGRSLRGIVLGVEPIVGGFTVTVHDHGDIECRTLIVASGATPRALNAPGAAELLGHGLGYSVTTHAHILDGKSVAVIGTTARALRGVAEIAPSAAKVYLIAPDPAALPPDWSLDPNVELLAGYQVEEVIGPRLVSELVLSKDGKRSTIGVDAAFVDLGLRGNSRFIERLVAINREGFILVDERNATSMAGIFAAGDVTSAFGEQVLIAIGEGARAALSAYDYLLAQRSRAPMPVTLPTMAVGGEAAEHPLD